MLYNLPHFYVADPFKERVIDLEETEDFAHDLIDQTLVKRVVEEERSNTTTKTFVHYIENREKTRSKSEK